MTGVKNGNYYLSGTLYKIDLIILFTKIRDFIRVSKFYVKKLDKIYVLAFTIYLVQIYLKIKLNKTCARHKLGEFLYYFF